MGSSKLFDIGWHKIQVKGTTNFENTLFWGIFYVVTYKLRSKINFLNKFNFVSFKRHTNWVLDDLNYNTNWAQISILRSNILWLNYFFFFAKYLQTKNS